MTSTPPTATTERPAGPDDVGLRQRLRRVAGQVLGTERMIADGRPCGDVLVQLAAAQGALRAAALQALTPHTPDADQRGWPPAPPPSATPPTNAPTSPPCTPQPASTPTSPARSGSGGGRPDHPA